MTTSDNKFDPFSSEQLEKLRLPQDFAASTDIKPVLTSVSARKPNRQEFIRVRPGEENKFSTLIFTDKESREVYLATPDVADLIPGDLTPALIVVVMARNSKVPFLWPLTLPDAFSKPNRWWETALAAAKVAETQWCKVCSDLASGQYVPYVATGNLPDPDWGQVPPIGDLLRLAFRDRFINHADHPVIKRLRGEE